MKISRLEIENFAIDESPTITEQSIAGKDLLLYGGNRSGKSLSFNAILYGLYGRSGTFGISPGQSSKVNIHFDSADTVSREGNHEFRHGEQTLDADDGVKEYVGPEETVRLQFITANPANQPISSLSGEHLLNRIRTVLSSEKQSVIECHRRAKAELDHLKEIRRRGEDQLGVRELQEKIDNLQVQQIKNRIEEIEELQELIVSGQIGDIIERLQQKDKVTTQLNELLDRRRDLEQTLREKRRELGDAKRYTQEIDDLIIDAIQEFTCPVCGRLVEESTARQRLSNRCPQCGRPRDLSELRDRLSEKVSKADTRIDELKEEIADFEEELASVEAEIEELQEANPDLSDLTPFIKTALDQADYDIDQLRGRTTRELETHQNQLKDSKETKNELEEELEERRALLEAIEQSKSVAEERIASLEEEAFNDVIGKFTDKWSKVYKDIAPGIGIEIGLTPNGELELPGTGSEGIRSYDRLSSGERRLVNLSFAITLAEFARENSESHNWEVLVLDEPLTNLESEIQDTAARYLRDSDIQCIMTSPLKRAQSHFRDDDAQIIKLELITTEATTLEEYL
jgi:DNA repair exonuclease SbcCD ATPase subunit